VTRAVVSIGSNIDPRRNVDRALEILSQRFELLSTSRLVWTDPIGRPDQPRYLNGAVMLDTSLGPEELRRALHRIEEEMGRRRSEDKYAPRRIDLDLVVYDGQVLDCDVESRDFLRQAVREVTSSGQ
jgi:2-amino-4-hydroxy-6-hydroxymethyldihydropteridine diphosphokinase